MGSTTRKGSTFSGTASVLQNAFSVNFYVTCFGTNSQRELHMPNVSVKPKSFEELM